MSSNNLDKYKYLASEDLDLKPSAVEQARFEYSPFGKTFNKGPKEEDKKGLLKRLKKNIKKVTDFVRELLTLEAKELTEEIKTIQEDVDYRKLNVTSGNNITYDFSDYRTFKELFIDIYYKNMSINEVEKNKWNLMAYLVL